MEERRSSRYRDFIPIGYSSKLNWRKGYILFAWLVDRYFYKVSFNQSEKRMMYFTQSKWSNEPINKRADEVYNQFYYEQKLQKLLSEDEVQFARFRYSVQLIYVECNEVPIATHMQLITDNEDVYFNVIVPNAKFQVEVSHR